MAIVSRDHLSHEAGHQSGFAGVVTTIGLILVVVGVLVFLGAVVLGMVDARNGPVPTERTARFLPLGGGAVVMGTLVAALGMTWARWSAGE